MKSKNKSKKLTKNLKASLKFARKALVSINTTEITSGLNIISKIGTVSKNLEEALILLQGSS